MARPRPSDRASRLVVAALAPGERGVPEAWRGPLRDEPLLRAVAAAPGLARALPVLAGRVEREGLADGLDDADRALVEITRAWSEARVASLAAALREAGAACARERVPALLCKGAALHGLLYEHPSDRPSADADLYVPERDVARFHDVLLGCGFSPRAGTAERMAASRARRRPAPWLVDLAYERPGAVFEVKADPVGMGHPVRRLDDLSLGATPSPAYPGLLVPSAEAQALQQTFSLARRTAPDVLAHAELAGVLVARRAELDSAALAGLVRGEGLGGIASAVLADTEALFPGSVPADLAARVRRLGGATPARLRRGAFAPPARETAWSQASLWTAHALGGRRPLAAARWALSRLFPPEPLLAHLEGGGRLGRLLHLARRAGSAS